MTTKQDIIKYVEETPYNTNPNMVRNMLDNIESGDTPTGSIDIHEDGKYDVTDYAEADVHIFLENYINSCTIAIGNNVSSYLSGKMAVLRYYDQVPEGYYQIIDIPTNSNNAAYFHFISEILPAGRIPYNRFYLDLEINGQYTPLIDTTLTKGNDPKLGYDSDAKKYYLYDLTDGDEIVLTLNIL